MNSLQSETPPPPSSSHILHLLDPRMVDAESLGCYGAGRRASYTLWRLPESLDTQKAPGIVRNAAWGGWGEGCEPRPTEAAPHSGRRSPQSSRKSRKRCAELRVCRAGYSARGQRTGPGTSERNGPCERSDFEPCGIQATSFAEAAAGGPHTTCTAQTWTPTACSTEEEKHHIGFYQILKICSVKSAINIMERQATAQEKISAHPISDKGPVSRIYKEHVNLSNREINKPIKKLADLRRHLTKGLQMVHGKMLNVIRP